MKSTKNYINPYKIANSEEDLAATLPSLQLSHWNREFYLNTMKSLLSMPLLTLVCTQISDAHQHIGGSYHAVHVLAQRNNYTNSSHRNPQTVYVTTTSDVYEYSNLPAFTGKLPQGPPVVGPSSPPAASSATSAPPVSSWVYAMLFMITSIVYI